MCVWLWLGASGEKPTYVAESMPLAFETDETQQYVPQEELLHTPFIKDALFHEDKAQEEAKNLALSQANG